MNNSAMLMLLCLFPAVAMAGNTYIEFGQFDSKLCVLGMDLYFLFHEFDRSFSIASDKVNSGQVAMGAGIFGGKFDQGSKELLGLPIPFYLIKQLSCAIQSFRVSSV